MRFLRMRSLKLKSLLIAVVFVILTFFMSVRLKSDLLRSERLKFDPLRLESFNFDLLRSFFIYIESVRSHLIQFPVASNTLNAVIEYASILCVTKLRITRMIPSNFIFEIMEFL